MDRALLLAWGRDLLNRRRPYARQQADGSYRWVYERCDVDVLATHLAGTMTIAVAARDAAGLARWVCLDSDAPDGLAALVRLRDALGDLGFPGIAEASRRGGHLWLRFTESAPVLLARRAVLGILARLRAQGVAVPAVEVYPDGDQGLGHGVRLPLGVHRQSGRRYPLLGGDGRPMTFSSLDGALAWWQGQPRIPLSWLRASWDVPATVELPALPPASGTRSVLIRWVDASVNPLDLVAEYAPGSALRPVGRGYLGWCPFHPDAAPQADGSPGTPSFTVYQHARYGWSWRCLSTNCGWHGRPQHTFTLFCALLGVDARTGLAMAHQRWPEGERRIS